jgi:predicted RNA-binding protein with RPS1 domain
VFVETRCGTDGLLHVSEIANHRVKDVRDELKEGEQIREGHQHRPDGKDSLVEVLDARSS